MILPVYMYGHPVLRKKAENISQDSQIEDLIADMFETMYHDRGVGLAAPQIGKSIRLFVIDNAPYVEMYPQEEAFKGVFINPEIIDEFGDDFSFNEGCLSIPDINAEIIRKSELEIDFTDENGKRQKRFFKGVTARIIQHEYDHLEGKVFIDYLPPIKKMVLKRKLSEIASGKYKPFYKSMNK